MDDGSQREGVLTGQGHHTSRVVGTLVRYNRLAGSKPPFSSASSAPLTAFPDDAAGLTTVAAKAAAPAPEPLPFVLHSLRLPTLASVRGLSSSGRSSLPEHGPFQLLGLLLQRVSSGRQLRVAVDSHLAATKPITASSAAGPPPVSERPPRANQSG